MAWINLSRNRTKSKSFSDTWKVLQLGSTRPAIAVPTAPNQCDTDLPLPLPLPCAPHICRSADPRCPPRASARSHDESSPLSLPPALPHLPLASLAESPVPGATQPLPSVRPEPVPTVFPFGPIQSMRCQRGKGIASREPLAGEGGETCAERGGATVNPLGSGLPASQLQLVLVSEDTTALPPPAEEPSAWPWTWQERLRAAKRRRMDAGACAEAAHGEAGGAGGTQDWGKLEAGSEEERRRKQRLGILSGMRQMLDSPGFAAARGQKRKFVVRQGGLKHRVPATRGASSASGSGDQSSENTNSEERAAEAARDAENARAAAGVATLAAHDAAQLAIGGRVDAAAGVDSTGAAAPHHTRELGSSVMTVRFGGTSSGRNGGRSGGSGRGGEYEVESTQCAAEKAEEGSSLAERAGAAHPSASPGTDPDEPERAGEERKTAEAQKAADGVAGCFPVRRRHSHPSPLGRTTAPPSTTCPPVQPRIGSAPPVLPRALPSAPCTALTFPLLSPDTPHRPRLSNPSRSQQPSPLPCRVTIPLAEPLQARQTRDPEATGAAAEAAVAPETAGSDSAVAASAAAAAIAASMDFPLWVRQLQACAGAGEEGRASECTGETPGSMLEVPQAQPDMEGSDASGGSGSSGEGSAGEEVEDEVESRGGKKGCEV